MSWDETLRRWDAAHFQKATPPSDLESVPSDPVRCHFDTVPQPTAGEKPIIHSNPFPSPCRVPPLDRKRALRGAQPPGRWQFSRCENCVRVQRAAGTGGAPRVAEELRRSARRWFLQRENHHHTQGAAKMWQYSRCENCACGRAAAVYGFDGIMASWSSPTREHSANRVVAYPEPISNSTGILRLT